MLNLPPSTTSYHELPHNKHYTRSTTAMGKHYSIFLYLKALTDLLVSAKKNSDVKPALDVVQLKIFAPQDRILSLYERSKLAIYHTPTCDLKDLDFVHAKWSFNNRIRRRDQYWGAGRTIFSGLSAGTYRHISPESPADKASIKEAIEHTRQDFRSHTGMEPSRTVENSSYQFQYQCMQLDLIALMVWEGGNRKIPKLLTVGPWEKGFDDWDPPDISARIVSPVSNR